MPTHKHFKREGDESSPTQQAKDYDIRCLHIDYTRPAEGEDAQAGERHWRCPSIFPFEPTADIAERAYCPYHRPIYRTSEHVVTKKEAEDITWALAERLKMQRGQP